MNILTGVRLEETSRVIFYSNEWLLVSSLGLWLLFSSTQFAFMAKLVRHLTSNEEIVSSNLAEGILFLQVLGPAP